MKCRDLLEKCSCDAITQRHYHHKLHVVLYVIIHTVVPVPNLILATDIISTSGSIYTLMFNGRQAMQLNLDLDDDIPHNRPSIGEYIYN